MDENDRALTAFTMLGHGTFHSYELVIPVFVVVWLDIFETTTAVLGVVVGGSYALVGLGALPAGLLADRFSSRRVILGSLVGMGVAFALVGLAPGIAVLAVALLVWGTAASLYHPAALALISRGAKERGPAFAYHGMAGNVGVATGPLLAAVLLVFFHWRIVAAVLVVPTILAVALGVRLDFDEAAGTATRRDGVQTDHEQTESSVRSDGGRGDDGTPSGGQQRTARTFLSDSRSLFTAGFLVVFTTGLLYGVYYRGLFTFLPDILAGLEMFEPVEWRGRAFEPGQYVYSGLLLLGAVGQYAGGKLVERAPIEYALVGVYLALAVIALAVVPAMSAGLGTLLVVAGGLGFLAFLVAPVNQEAIAVYSAPSLRGLSFGYSYTAIFGLGALGATLAGAILSRWSAAVLFGTLAGVGCLATGLATVLLFRSDRWERTPPNS